MNIMYKVKKYIKFMIKGIWHILPISSKKKVVFQYKWKMSRILRYLSRDLSTEMCQALEVQYKVFRNGGMPYYMKSKQENFIDNLKRFIL